mgnify:FL=1
MNVEYVLHGILALFALSAQYVFTCELTAFIRGNKVTK